MKNKLTIILLSIGAIVLAVALVAAHRQLSELEQQLAATRPAPAAETKPAPVEPAEEMAEAAEAAVEETIATVQETATKTAVEAVETEEESRSRRMMKNIAKMMKNPAMNKMMEASQRGALGSMYEDLIRRLNLNGDEEKYFMDLLMFRQMTNMDAGMKMMGGNLSDEEKEEMQTQIKDATDLVKKEMKDFLNSEEDYEAFEFFEKTMQERMMLSQAEASLAETDHVLTDDTYEDLVRMMHDEKKNFDFSSDLNDQDNMDISPERFSKMNLQAFAEDLDQLNETIFSKAQNMLTAEQFAAFKDAVTTTTDMQKAQLEMVGQMFGGGK